MKALLITIVTAVGLIGPAAAASWAYPAFELQAQGPKGRQGEGERAQPGREANPERRQEREERRERLNEDERKALHRDLDKAHRELYQRRRQQ